MNLYKRIISLFVVLAMCISLMVLPVSATNLVPAGSYSIANFAQSVAVASFLETASSYLSGGGEYLSTLWDAIKTGVCDGCGVNPSGQHDFIPRDPVGMLVTSWEAAIYGSEACTCHYCGITFDEFYNSTYDDYVSSLQTDLGTTTLIDGGVRMWMQPLAVYSQDAGAHECYVSGSTLRFIHTRTYTSQSQINYNYVKYPSVVAPFNGTIRAGYIYSGHPWLGDSGSLSIYPSYSSAPTVLITEGSTYYFGHDNTSFASILYGEDSEANQKKTLRFAMARITGVYDGSFAVYVDMIPSVALSDVTTMDITVNSRPSTIVGDYGIIGDDGTIIHVEGNVIVDESTNTVYNPVTNTTNNYNEYEFDYSDRSYNLTLEDGSTLRVVYGDENITIEQGDTIYNIYYLIPNVPGGDDPGSGDDPGDIPGGEDWSWWRKAWQEFTDKLFGILGNGSTVNPDNAPSVPGDEDTGDEGYTIIDLFVVLKDGTWAFITGIVGTAYDGFTSFVESVISAGSFFTFYDEESEESILFIPLEDGETIWD